MRLLSILILLSLLNLDFNLLNLLFTSCLNILMPQAQVDIPDHLVSKVHSGSGSFLDPCQVTFESETNLQYSFVEKDLGEHLVESLTVC